MWVRFVIEAPNAQVAAPGWPPAPRRGGAVVREIDWCRFRQRFALTAHGPCAQNRRKPSQKDRRTIRRRKEGSDEAGRGFSVKFLLKAIGSGKGRVG